MLSVHDKYQIRDKVFRITADNASNNCTMALALQEAIPQFSAQQQMLGFLPHVLNLAVQGAFKFLKLSKWNSVTTEMLEDKFLHDVVTKVRVISIYSKELTKHNHPLKLLLNLKILPLMGKN